MLTNQWRWMIVDGAVVPRCGAGSLVKFIFRRVCESSVCMFARVVVAVVYVSHRLIQVFVPVRIRCS